MVFVGTGQAGTPAGQPVGPRTVIGWPVAGLTPMMGLTAVKYGRLVTSGIVIAMPLPVPPWAAFIVSTIVLYEAA